MVKLVLQWKSSYHWILLVPPSGTQLDWSMNGSVVCFPSASRLSWRGYLCCCSSLHNTLSCSTIRTGGYWVYGFSFAVWSWIVGNASRYDVIKWKHFPRYWPSVWGIHWSTMNSPHKGQWRGALMFSLICAWTNGRINNRDAGALRRHRAHYNVTVMKWYRCQWND